MHVASPGNRKLVTHISADGTAIPPDRSRTKIALQIAPLMTGTPPISQIVTGSSPVALGVTEVLPVTIWATGAVPVTQGATGNNLGSLAVTKTSYSPLGRFLSDQKHSDHSVSSPRGQKTSLYRGSDHNPAMGHYPRSD